MLQTTKNSILVAAGKVSTQQMGAAFVDMVVVSGGYLVGAHIGGIIGQAIASEKLCDSPTSDSQLSCGVYRCHSGYVVELARDCDGNDATTVSLVTERHG